MIVRASNIKPGMTVALTSFDGTETPEAWSVEDVRASSPDHPMTVALKIGQVWRAFASEVWFDLTAEGSAA